MKSDLTAERLRELVIYHPETGLFEWRLPRSGVGPGLFSGSPGSQGYLRIQIDGQRYAAHRLAWLYAYGEWPKRQIDHKNKVRSDNRLRNLRPASNAQNSRNRKLNRNNTSGHRGVFWSKVAERWQTYIMYKGKYRHLGLFDSIDLAVEFRQLAEAMIDPVFYGHC